MLLNDSEHLPGSSLVWGWEDGASGSHTVRVRNTIIRRVSKGWHMRTAHSAVPLNCKILTIVTKCGGGGNAQNLPWQVQSGLMRNIFAETTFFWFLFHSTVALSFPSLLPGPL